MSACHGRDSPVVGVARRPARPCGPSAAFGAEQRRGSVRDLVGNGPLFRNRDEYKRPQIMQHNPSLHIQRVQTVVQIRDSVHEFNRGLGERATTVAQWSLLRTTWNWVLNPARDAFGPSKFVGYQGMTFALYHAAKSKQTWGDPLDGRLSRSAIEAVLGSGFSHDRQACARLVGWAEHALGPGIFDGIDQGKWRFITLPTPVGVDARASSTGEKGSAHAQVVQRGRRKPLGSGNPWGQVLTLETPGVRKPLGSGLDFELKETPGVRKPLGSGLDFELKETPGVRS